MIMETKPENTRKRDMGFPFVFISVEMAFPIKLCLTVASSSTMNSTMFFGLALLLIAGFSHAEEVSVFNGTSISEFPSLVQIEFSVDTLWVQGCTGNLLTSRHILSAATCFSGSLFTLSARRVRAGATFQSSGGDIREIQTAVNFPRYNDTTGGNLSVLTLATPFILGPTIAQGTIIAPGIVIPANLTVINAGWGLASKTNSSANNTLTSVSLTTVSLTTVSQEVCTNLYSNSNITLSNDIICAGESATTGSELNSVDVGGPLYFDNIIVGILSFGGLSGNVTNPIVATDVSTHTNWIVSQAV